MIKQIPESIKENRIIIAKSYKTQSDTVVKELNKIDYNRLEVTGFSAGGKNVFELAKVIDINFVGLIDPSVPHNWSLDYFPPGNESILFFDNSNWDYYKGIQERQEKLAIDMKEKGMKVVQEDLNHSNFPKVFFTKYIN